MNKRQKAILLNFATVITITILAVVGMINLKDWMNRSEAIKAMEHLGQIVLRYRKSNGSVPPESYIDGVKADLEGYSQLGKVNYRARWIGFESTPDEVLAYAKKTHHSSFLGDGYVVLRLDGRVEWMGEQDFDALLPEDKREMEAEILNKELRPTLPPLF